MRTYKQNILLVAVALCILGFIACSDPWDDHTHSGDASLEQNLSERLMNESETSVFGQLLVETGYDSILKASKTFTVWVPSNAAMEQVSSNFTEDIEQSRRFIENHIALSTYSSVNDQDTVTVHMLSNKYLEFINGETMAESSITMADQYASNGLFHIIDEPLEPRLNIWEYLQENTASNSAVSNYLSGLDQFNIYHRSDSLAKADPEAGTIYADSLTNSFLYNVYNLNNETNKYTFFLMENEGFSQETEKLIPYLNKGGQDSTVMYSQYFALRDMAFLRSYAQENLPDTLTSRFGVNVPIDKNQIIEEIRLSNGVVYRMNTMDVPLETRLVTTQIEGEEPIGFSQDDKEANTFYREKSDPQGEIVYDIMVRNHGEPRFAINYSASNMFSTTYEVYWRAVNDIQSNTFQQQVRIGGTYSEEGEVVDPIAELPYTNVPPEVYDEVYVGEFTLEQAGDVDLISLIAANTGTGGDNTLTLDYLKLVPIIK